VNATIEPVSARPVSQHTPGAGHSLSESCRKSNPFAPARRLSYGYRMANTRVSIQVILVPATDALLNGRDRESPRPYADLVRDEDFLASHVLRVEGGNGVNGKDVSSLRESRGKAKSYTTVNGRTVIIKENQVYSNKGTTSRFCELEVPGILTRGQGLGPSRMPS
jgi:hypothetical protein